MLSTGQTRVRAWESICRGCNWDGLVIGTGRAGQSYVEDIRWLLDFSDMQTDGLAWTGTRPIWADCSRAGLGWIEQVGSGSAR